MSSTPPGVPSDAGAGVRFDAVLHLQKRLERTRPDSDAHERADLALYLVLSDRRQADTARSLIRNACRDARKLLVRRRQRVTTDPLTGDTPLGLAAVHGKLPACVIRETPLDLLIAADLERRIRSDVRAAHGARGVRVLDALLSGESVQDTASALDVSLRTVERLRLAVRSSAAQIARGGQE